MVRSNIILANVIFYLFLTFQAQAQVVWEENFSATGKGYWMDESNILQSDFSGVEWKADITKASFAATGDYAKTVSTSGGRFEVLDSDGDVVWYSPKLDISNYTVVTVSVKTSETGSSTSATKKFVKAAYWLDNRNYSFSPDSVSAGNWGEKVLTAKGIKGESLQLVVTMNSSYSNDKVIIDDVVVEGIDSSLFEPQKILLREAPTVLFSGEAGVISAVVINKKGETITDREYPINLTGKNLEVADKTFKDGIYSWKVTSDSLGKQGFAIKGEGLDIGEVDHFVTVYSRSNLILYEDFEDGNSEGWISNEQWGVSGDTPIAGSYSMKHQTQPANGNALLIREDSERNLGDGDYLFSFELKNGAWDPSSSNAFYFEVTDSGVLPNGYVIGVNAKGSSDLVSLWTIVKGTITTLVAETSYDWNENGVAKIDIQRKAEGKWTLTVTDRVTGSIAEAEGFDNEFSEWEKTGLSFKYTQSRSGQLWFDDLLVLRENTPPGIRSVKTVKGGKIEVCFTEPVNTDKLKKEDFEIKSRTGGTIFATDEIEAVSRDTILLIASEINDTELLLSVKEFEDMEGAKGKTEGYLFDYSFPVAEHDVVITEIMADPTPVVGLPDGEYIELYNQSGHTVNLRGWKLTVRSSTEELPAFKIYPEEYLILCATSDSIAFKPLGKTLPVQGFPSLLNSGCRIILEAEDGTKVDEVSYLDDWYRDPVKKNGGWSLERIDPARNCGTDMNWVASKDTLGGTPGKENSVNAVNEDTIAPRVTGTKLVSARCYQINLSETVDSSSVYNLENYQVDGGKHIDSIVYHKEENSLLLWLNEGIEPNREYGLTVSGLEDECGNWMETFSVGISWQLIRPKDIVINEVLFNPKSGGSDYVELYNRSGITLDLSILKLATRNDTMGLRTITPLSEVSFNFRDKGYLVFTKDSLDLVTNYWVPDKENIIQLKAFPSYPDDAGRVVLVTDSLKVIDEFAYSATMQSKWLSEREGVSLERLSAEGESSDADNWHSASSMAGYGTPGYENSQKEAEPEDVVSVTIMPEAISPNYDQFNDEMTISFHLDKPGYLANVSIFDMNGRKVNRLLNNCLMGSEEKIVFGGTYANGTLLPMGVYVLMVELIHSSGTHKVVKKAFLVTDRQ